MSCVCKYICWTVVTLIVAAVVTRSAPTLYLHVASSDFAPGKVVHNFGAGDYSVLETSDLCPFTIDPSTGELLVSQTIDFSAGNFTSRCLSTPSGYLPSLVSFYCLVLHSDNDQPILTIINVTPDLTGLAFPQVEYSGVVIEGTENARVSVSGLQVVTVPFPGLLLSEYHITEDSSEGERFSVSSETVTCNTVPVIVSNTALNRTEQFHYNITLDVFSGNFTAATILRIQVLDINNHPPVPADMNNSLFVEKGALPGTPVVSVTANDADLGLNGNIRFSLASLSSYLTIHPFTGSLSLYRTLDYQTDQPFSLTISLQDHGHPTMTTEANVTIFISDVNEYPPIIHVLGTHPVDEGSVGGLVVATVAVSDVDSAPSSLSLVISSSTCDCFQLSADAQTFSLTLTAALDYETVPQGYHIILLASDNDTPTLNTTYDLLVTVTDQNEPPFFVQPGYQGRVPEGAPVGTEILRIMASDPDIGTNAELTYEIRSLGLHGSWFAIDAESGVVYTTTSDIDHDVAESVELMVMASDVKGQHASTTLTVTIEDVNNHKPTWAISDDIITVSEDLTSSDAVFVFFASDLDSLCNGGVMYSLLHSEPPVFRIDSLTGTLYPLDNSSLDYETFQTATVVVQAQDQGERWSYSAYYTLTVQLVDVDDEIPVVDPIDCSCWITENAAGQQCQPLTAYDADSSSLTFHIQSGNEASQFAIDETNGVVRSVNTLDREQQAEYTLMIVASDQLHDSEPQMLRILVVDINDSPPSYRMSSVNIKVPHDMPVGEYVGNATAEHPDAGFNGLTVYSATVGEYFGLDSLSGQIYTKLPLTNVPSLTFTVTAQDLLTPTQRNTVNVNLMVEGMVNHPPVFSVSSERFLVAANHEVGSGIMLLSAMDPDDDDLTYSLVGENTLFTLEQNGLVRLTQSLLALSGAEYSLNVSCTDDVLTAYQEVTIAIYATSLSVGGVVFQHNSGVPVCHETGDVPEHSDGGHLVLTLPTTQSSQTATYSILEEDIPSAFQLNGLEIVSEGGFGQAFDRREREALHLTLRAIYGDNFLLCSVTVLIEDENDQGPVFLENQYSTEVYRNTPVGASVFTFRAVDEDIGTNAEVTYTLLTTATPFGLRVAGSDVLHVTGQLTQSNYVLQVQAADANDPDKTATATLTITILETSNTEPQLPNLNPLDIDETHPLGTITQLPPAIDPDNGVHARNSYCILSGNYYGLFGVDQAGNILLDKPLDYDHEGYPRTYSLDVAVFDSSPNPQYNSTTIAIEIQARNDESPVFTAPSYTATVNENLDPGVLVVTVTATDRDGDAVEYSILGSNVHFNINGNGDITTTNRLNREAGAFFDFTVMATDGQRSSTTLVTVLVLDDNDNEPEWDTPSQTRTLPEGMAPGSTLLPVLEATDDDEGASSVLWYSIVSGNENFIFSLDPWTGVISLARSLDYESDTETYTLTFAVQDLGIPPRTASTTVTITYQLGNDNDNYPQFSQLLYTCNVTMAMFDSPCQVHATDADMDSLQFIIDSDQFSINQAGQLSVISDSPTSTPVVVLAVDNGTPALTSSVLVVITVMDTNDHLPEIIPQSPSVLVPESAPTHSLLFYVHAQDRDGGIHGDIEYFNQDQSDPLFTVDKDTGAVFLVGALDYEIASSHTLTVLPSNLDGASPPATVYSVVVMDVDENTLPPLFSDHTPSAIVVSRGISPGTFITTVTAVDSDPGPDGVVRYSITGGSGLGYFLIDGHTGNISLSRGLGAVSDNHLSLTITATDSGPFPLFSSISLLLLLQPDPDSKPFFLSPEVHAFVPENQDDIIFSHVLALINGNVHPDIQYSITGGNERGLFAVDGSTGAISVPAGVTVDYETQSLYSLTIQASRPDINVPSTALVVVQVNDSDEGRPEFPSGYVLDVQVFESFPLSQEVMRVFAVDEASELEYTIVSPDDQLPFNISSCTGKLYLTQSLEGLAGSVYTFTVMATDLDGLQGTTEVQVTVAAPAVQQPVFSDTLVSIQIPEDTPPGGSVIYTVQPMGVGGGTLMYWITESPPQFTIHPNSGQVFLTQPLDREEVPNVKLDIEVWDGTESEVARFSLVIEFTDVNDHRPALSTRHFSFAVEEHVGIGTRVGTVTGSDRDDVNTANANLTFSLVDAEHLISLGVFEMDDSGVLRAMGDLDREELPVHTLTVAVRDGGSPALLTYGRVTVTITDINDHTPMFQSPYSQISIPEDTPEGTVVFTVLAFDPDVGSHAEISYSLQPPDVPFSLDQSTGNLAVSQPLDAESVTSYTLTVTAYHPLIEAQSSLLQLNVTILDVLNSPPSLALPSNLVELSENLPPYTSVTSVSAQGNTRPVYYSIVAGNELQHFFVEPLTGTVRTSTALDREAVSSYEITLCGAYSPGFEANITLHVLVLDENDNPPLFPFPILTFTLSLLNPTSLPLGVTDLDDGMNGQVDAYLIPDPSAARYFTVLPSGNLLLHPLSTAFSSVQFEVYAIDGGTPPLYSHATVVIITSDTDVHPPVFSSTDYQITVSTPVSVGAQLFAVSASGDGQLTYSITGGNGTGTFEINPVSGALSVAYNFRLQSVYTLEVAAADGAGRVGQSTVTISVRECEYQGLAFAVRDVTLEVPEDTEVNTVVYRPDIINRESASTLEFIFSLPTPPTFSLDQAAGTVTIVSSLDRESTPTYQLVVQAKDSANPDRIAQVDIKLLVVDINDNSPTFLGTPYSASVVKDAMIGEHVLTLSASDPDLGGRVTYHISSEFSTLFHIDPDSGWITVASSLLSTELGSTIPLTVWATDNDSPPLSSQTLVSVSIVDPNAPSFTQNVYRTNISESASPTTVVFTVLATVASGQITYSIDDSGEGPPLPFNLDAFTGELTVNDRELDYDTVSFYQVSLLAVDPSSQLMGHSRVDITILDENDISPAFTQFNYFRSINESSEPGTTVLTVTAMDGDSAPNAQVSYELQDGEGGVFLVDTHSGVITTARDIDHEETASFEIIVLALDSGIPQRTGSTTVTVFVENINDNSPAFVQSLYTVLPISADGVILGSTLLLVRAEDRDQDPIVYSLLPGLGSENFVMSTNGLLSFNSNSVSLTEFQYLLNISACDGMFCDFASVEVEVDHGNAHNPVFNQTSYSATVVEGSPAGVFIARVFASDDDQGSNGEVRYSRSNLQEGVFTVDAESGIITTAGGQIDREKTPVINMVVTARDGGGKSGIVNVEITVLDVNDNAPAFTQQQYITNIVESSMPGMSVLSVEAVDPDAGANGTVEYTHSNTDVQFPFAVDDSTGQITLVLNVDHERVPEYVFFVSAMDMGDPRLTSEMVSVTIHILDTLDTPPVFEQNPYNFSVPERTSPPQVIGTVQTMGIADCDLLGYIIDGSNVPFEIIRHTGDIEVVEFLRRVDQDVYSFIVEAQCIIGSDTLRDFTLVTVQVLDVNEKPDFDTLQLTLSVPENLESGSVIVPGEIQAVDPDLGDNMTVTLELLFLNGSLLFGEPFKIVQFQSDPLKGLLCTTGQLDRELVSEYVFFVRATDHGTPPMTSSNFVRVRVEVTDINDSPPTFSQDEYFLDLPEDTPPGSVIFHAAQFISDLDEVGVFTYTVDVVDPPPTIGTPFKIEGDMTGEVRTTVALDRESISAYFLLITVNDGRITASAFLHVNLTDANDNRPVFDRTEYLPVSVREDIPVNTVFLQVSATDADQGDNAIISYSFVDNDGHFAINSSSGEISFARAPDYEVPSSRRLEVRVRATDGTPDTSDQQLAKVVVLVLDVNDNPPTFTQGSYNFSVRENSPTSTTIGVVSAIDPDSGANGNVTYSIASPGASSFHIDQQNGIVKTLQIFNRETNSSFALSITATDSGNISMSSSTTVFVSIEDENDNAPTFPRESYTVNVSEFLPPGEILRVQAEDRDTGGNGDIIYSLMATGDTENININDAFSLTETPEGAASLSIVDELNHESIQSYSLVLVATDRGLPSRQSSSASILVIVVDENDNAPIFSETPYPTQNLMEDEPVGTTIITVHATDLDATDNVQLLYSIEEAERYPELQINSTSGDILIARSLDYETQTSYTLTIIASDRRDQPQAGMATVNIEVQDVNDNAPQFIGLQKPVHTISVLENQDPRILLQLEVEDEDTVSNHALVTFSILSGDEHERFEVERASGILRVLTSLDREDVGMYQLVVGAEDHGVPSLTGSAHITIIVDDLNDNLPQTEMQTVYIFLYRGQLASSFLGTVFVEDPDLDNDHIFTISSPDSENVFDINQEGEITIAQTPAPIDYSLSVTVTDTGHRNDSDSATTTVLVRVGSVSNETTSNSFRMQLDGVTPDVFVVEKLETFVSNIESMVLDATSLSGVSVKVFAIQPSADGELVDVVLAVQTLNGGYVHPTLVQHLIHVSRNALEQSLGVQVVTELADPCATETCERGEECEVIANYQLARVPLGSASSVTHLGLKASYDTSCGGIVSLCESLPCPEPSYCVEEKGLPLCWDDCSANPCKNSGRCVPQTPGYYCSCPEGFDGRNCELNTATFQDGSYALFPPIGQRSQGTISVDMITDRRQTHGLLVYSGRFDSQPTDFLALVLQEGHPTLLISYGEMSAVVSLEAKANDELWHSISAVYNSSVSAHSSLGVHGQLTCSASGDAWDTMSPLLSANTRHYQYLCTFHSW